jgi:putative protease
MPKIKAKAKAKLKKIVKKTVAKKPVKTKKEKPIGIITHFFSDISVVVIKLSAPLKKGDKIRIAGGQETDFDQKVDSIQIDYKDVSSAKKGSSIGIKVKEKARDGYKVFKI